MSDRSAIEWTDATWNPVTGCTEVSRGCDRCYANAFAERWRGTPGHYFERGFDVQLRPEKLDQPLLWTRPRRVFVNSMSDLFHDAVPDEYIAQVFAVMALAPQHTFQLLTKRHARMRSLVTRGLLDRLDDPGNAVRAIVPRWPLPNVWLGVSAETQQWADIRIPALLDTPAAVRFVSAEPLLGPLKLADEWLPATCGKCDCDMGCNPPAGGLDWVIVGGESGSGARPMHPRWANALHQQCEAVGVPFHFKQWGAWTPMAPKLDHRGGVVMTDDGRTYDAGDLDYPDGLRRSEAYLNDFPHHHPTFMYRLGKHLTGRELYHDGRTFDGYPAATP